MFVTYRRSMSTLDLAPPSSIQATGKLRAILDAAKRAIVRDGLTAISIDAIAADAGVSRQTVYNHLGDKEQLVVAVIRDVTARSSASLMAAVSTFPDKPDDLEASLSAFAVRLLGPCLCDIDGRALRWLLERESQRYPELLQAWQAYGPGQDWPIIAGCFARLAANGYLDIDDASVVARHFVALISADLPTAQGPCVRPPPEAIEKAAQTGVRTFLRAFASRQNHKSS